MNTTVVSGNRDSYETLRALLHADWGDDYKKEIDAILSGPGAMSEKIALIAKADARRRFSAENQAPAKNEQSASTAPVRRIPVDQREVARNQQKLKREHKPQNLISFVLFELAKIRQFGLERNAITSGFWGLLLKTSSDTERVLKMLLQLDVVPALKRSLSIVLKQGWLYLGKLDYNLLALADKLCGFLGKAMYRAGSRKTLRIDPNFKRAESLFFVFQHEPGYVSRAVEALYRVYRELDQSLDLKLAEPSTLTRLLGNTERGPQLYDCFLAVAMVANRRFLRMEDLFEHLGQRALVSPDEFDCDAAIKIEIDKHVSGLIKTLGPLLSDIHELNRLRSYIPVAPATGENQNAEPDFTHLAPLYKGAKGFDSFDFERDQENPVRFVSRFIEAFIETFGRLLGRGLTVDGGEKIELFGSHAYNTELARLQYCHIRLLRLAPSFPTFPRKRYEALRQGSEATAFEAEAMNNFTSASDTFAQLGLNMAGRIRDRVQMTDRGESPGIGLPLPHENRRVAEPGPLEGKTVIEALHLFTRTALLMALYLDEPVLSSKFRQETALRDKLERTLSDIERIATVEQYQAVLNDPRVQIVRPAG